MEDIIDCHVHLGNWIKSHFRMIDGTIKDLEKIYKDFWGLCVMPSDNMDNVKTKMMLSKSSLNTKFIAWYTGDNIQEIRQCKPDAVKLHPAYMHNPVYNEVYQPAINFAEAMDIPVYIHTGVVENSWHAHALRVARQYPKVKFVLCHAGGAKYQNHIDCALDGSYVKNVIIDYTSRKEFTLKESIKLIGENRSMFGSDWPIYHPSIGISAIKSVEGIDHNQILFKTAHDLLW
jgi:hypothetical protein